MNGTPPLIHRPHLQPATRRTLWGVVTALFWVAYLYLWLPLATLLLWLLGVRLAAIELYLQQHSADPFLLLALPVLAVTASSLLIGWGELNRWRFRGRDKRSAPVTVSHAEVAAALGASEAVTHALRDSRIAVLEMDEQARPRAVRGHQPAATPHREAEPA